MKNPNESKNGMIVDVVFELRPEEKDERKMISLMEIYSLQT